MKLIAGIDRPVDDADRVVVVGVAPGAEHHGSEAQLADLESGGSERAVVHGHSQPHRAAGRRAAAIALAGCTSGRYYRTYVRSRAGSTALPGTGPGGPRRPGRPGRAHPAGGGQPDPTPPGGPAAGRAAARRGAAPGHHPDRRRARRRRRPQRGPGPGGRRLGVGVVVRAGRPPRARGRRRRRPRHRPRAAGRPPPARTRPGPRPPPPCSRGSTWWCCARRSRPARPWPAGWWPGPASAGPCWWWSRAGPAGPSRPTCSCGSTTSAWEGVGAGEGHLRRRRMTVTATGRRSAVRPTPAPAVAARPRRAVGRLDAPVTRPPSPVARPPGRAGTGADVDRLLVVRCPDLLDEDEGGAALRTFAEVIAAVEAYCPWVTRCGPGSARCPPGARPATSVARAPWSTWSTRRPRAVTPAEVGVADGLFAAVLAARPGTVIVPPGGPRPSSPRCRWPSSGGPSWPSCSTGWGSAPWAGSPPCPTPTSSPGSGPTAPTATGWPAAEGELPGLRQPRTARLLAGGDGRRRPGGGRQPGFWGGVSDADARAARAWPASRSCSAPRRW